MDRENKLSYSSQTFFLVKCTKTIRRIMEKNTWEFFSTGATGAPPPLPQYPEWTQHPYPRSHLIAPTGDRGHAMVTDRRTTCTAHGPCGGLLWQRVQPSMGANVFVCDASQRSRLFWDVGDIFSLCGYMYQLFLLSLSSFVIHWMF